MKEVVSVGSQLSRQGVEAGEVPSVAAGVSGSCSHGNGGQEAESSHWTPGQIMNIKTHPVAYVCQLGPMPRDSVCDYPQILPESSSNG